MARWIEGLAAGGQFGRRSIQLFRTVLRAALVDAVEDGLIRRSPAARVGLPKTVEKAGRQKEADAWTEDEVDLFLKAVEEHRWVAPLRLAVLYGLRRSELLALKWDDVDFTARTVRVDEGLVEVHGRPGWTTGKNERSRRRFPIDSGTATRLEQHWRTQESERAEAGSMWTQTNLVVCTATGGLVHPGNFTQTLARLVTRAGVPRLTSHGLRHTAATHMLRSAAHMGDVRAAAQVLGHSPEMLIRVYAHALPDSLTDVARRIGERADRLAE